MLKASKTNQKFPDLFNNEAYRHLKFKIQHVKETWDRKLAEAKRIDSADCYNEAVKRLKIDMQNVNEILKTK
jgi:hypothetical protein